jgi:AmmeMemoRadiSam system protein B
VFLRQPAVAGTFNPRNARDLSRAVDEYCSEARDPASIPSDSAKGKISVYACMVPHAGYIYSGHVAGAAYRAIEIPARIILLGPRHYPAGESMAILSSGKWLTPLGEALIDAPLAEQLKHACPLLREDEVAHRREHSLEVQLPFLQRARPDFTFVPIVLGTDRWDFLESLGHALASVVRAQHEPVFLIASSDMNHYEPDDITRVKDNLAIERLLALDARSLYDTVHHERISMCGYAPAVCTVIAVRELGARHAELLHYATSGDVNGDRDQVVGYAGMIFHD